MIHTTKDYDKFKITKDNRTMDIAHKDKLKESMEIDNMLPLRPILIRENGEVIDGQHRLTAAKELGLEIHYMIADGSDSSLDAYNKVIQDLQPFVDKIAHLKEAINELRKDCEPGCPFCEEEK